MSCKDCFNSDYHFFCCRMVQMCNLNEPGIIMNNKQVVIPFPVENVCSPSAKVKRTTVLAVKVPHAVINV